MCDACSDRADYKSAPSTPERFAEVEERMRNTVLDEGHQIMGIFDPDGVEPTFYYTVGRGLFDKPELLLTGPLPQRVAMFILNEACAMIDDGRLVLNETGVTEVAPNELLSGFACRIVPADAKAADMTSALRMAPDLKAYQVIWPDTNGRWPEDADFDARFQQPIYAA